MDTNEHFTSKARRPDNQKNEYELRATLRKFVSIRVHSWLTYFISKKILPDKPIEDIRGHTLHARIRALRLSLFANGG